MHIFPGIHGLIHSMASFLCILSFKNEHLICGELKVSDFSFQELYIGGIAIK